MRHFFARSHAQPPKRPGGCPWHIFCRHPRTREWDGNGSLVEFIVSANLRRRHLKENQRAMVAARMLPHFEAEALKRMEHTEEGGPSSNCYKGG